jgi:5-methylthioadenosine/S-adenosylhomocysteine deaminase
LNDLNTLPSHHPASAIVYALNSRQVSDVWVRGQRRLARGELLDIDLDDLKRRIRGHQGAMTTTGQSGEAS